MCVYIYSGTLDRGEVLPWSLGVGCGGTEWEGVNPHAVGQVPVPTCLCPGALVVLRDTAREGGGAGVQELICSSSLVRLPLHSRLTKDI